MVGGPLFAFQISISSKSDCERLQVDLRAFHTLKAVLYVYIPRDLKQDIWIF